MLYKQAILTNSDYFEATKEYIAEKELTLDKLLNKEVISDSFSKLLNKHPTAKASIFVLVKTINLDVDQLISKIASKVNSMARSNSNISQEEIQNAVDSEVEAVFSTLKGSEELAKGRASLKNALKVGLGGIIKSLLCGLNFVSFAGLNQLAPDSTTQDSPGIISRTISKIKGQTKYKINASYAPEPPLPIITVWNVKNNYSDIKNLLIKWTHEIYDSVEDSDILKSSDFNNLVNNIIDINDSIDDETKIQMPGKFHTKKEVVDSFINDVAIQSPQTTKSSGRIHFFRRILKSS